MAADAGNDDGYYGVRRPYLQELVAYWADGFDSGELYGIHIGSALKLTLEQRVQNFLGSDRAAWYHHVNVTAHDRGGHFIPWEIPGEWVEDLWRTFRGRR